MAENAANVRESPFASRLRRLADAKVGHTFVLLTREDVYAAAAELDKLAAENAEYEVCAHKMLDALLMIRDEAGKPVGVGDLVADHSWCAGVAMSAVESLAERGRAWKQQHSHVPKFLPKWLGGEADRVSGPGMRLGENE